MADVEMGPAGPSGSHQGGGGGGNRGQKRARDGNPAAGGSGPEAAVKVKKMKLQEKAKSPSKPVAPSSHHLTRDEVPKGMKEAKTAIQMHIRASACLPTQASIPPNVTADEIDKLVKGLKVAGRSSVKDVALRNAAALVDENNSFFKRLSDAPRTAGDGGSITTTIRMIPSKVLSMIAGSCTELGLSRWAPDLLGSPSSYYNKIHEDVAIATFEQAVISRGYDFMGIDREAVFHDLEAGARILRAFYRSFVFDRLRSTLKTELKEQGRVAKLVQRGNAWKRRNSLATVRSRALLAEGAHPRLVKFAERPDVVSDDEYDAQDNMYYIIPKEGRSEKMKLFFKAVDQGHAMQQKRRTTGSRPKKGSEFRNRVDPPAPRPEPEDYAHVLPRTSVPIDWFDPGYWNNTLSLGERAAYTQHGVRVVLPTIDAIKHKSWAAIHAADWMKLPNKEFMKYYGDNVLKDYKIPTAQEREQLKSKFAADDGWDTSEEDSNSEEEEVEDGQIGR
ncbi:hypothetical protein K523DRAFT_332263 [Schizophyllum commune Tattone D]|nr:hypothetical protein K523DRAFT_332263 [Schizophyllum commune Tattone D]